MTALTHRTDVLRERHQDRKRTDHDYHCQQQPGIMRKGQKKVLSGRSSWMRFCYNKGAPVRWNRSAQVIEGMRWNHYRSCGKDTPFRSSLEHEKPPIASGAMKSLDSLCEKKTMDRGYAMEEARHPGPAGIGHEKGGGHLLYVSQNVSQNPVQQPEVRPDRINPCGIPPHEISSGHEPLVLKSEMVTPHQPEHKVPGYAAQNPNASSAQMDFDEGAPQKPMDAKPAAQAGQPIPGGQSILGQPNTNPAQVANERIAIQTPAPFAGTAQHIQSDIPAPQNMKAPLDVSEIGPAAIRGERQDVKIISAMPMHEGPMLSDPIVHRHSANQRSQGYIGSLRKKGIALKTAMASADPD